MAIYSEFSHKKWWFSIVMLVYQRVCSSCSVDPGLPWLRLRFVQALGFAAPADGNSVFEEKECIGLGRAWCSSPNDAYVQYVTMFAISWFQPEHWPIEHGALVQESIIAQCFQRIGLLSPLSQRTGLCNSKATIYPNYRKLWKTSRTICSRAFHGLFTYNKY